MSWAPSYATRADLAAYVRIADALDDVQLDAALSAASRAIDHACARQFGALDAAAPRVYTAALDPVTRVPTVHIDDLMSTTGLVVGVDTAGDGGYAGVVDPVVLLPVNAAADGRPWTRITAGRGTAVGLPLLAHGVRVTARWGWSAVPDTIRQACLMQASRILSRRDSPYGVAGSPEAGSEIRLLERMDPDVAVLVRHYARRWWAV